MRISVFASHCYIRVTTVKASIIHASTIFVCGVILIMSALSGWAQPVTLQAGYNFVGCNVNGLGGNNINNASFLQVPASLSDPTGPPGERQCRVVCLEMLRIFCLLLFYRGGCHHLGGHPFTGGLVRHRWKSRERDLESPAKA